MLAQVLPARAHVGVQLKGLKVHIGLHLALQMGQSGFQCAQAHGTPGAGNVRNKINFERGGQGGLSVASVSQGSPIFHWLSHCCLSSAEMPAPAGTFERLASYQMPKSRKTPL
jgi:hypothetical protein